MPIKGLTDQPARFPVLGILRKGSPKENGKMGKDLEHFRMDFYPQYKHLEQPFADLYGPKPKEIRGLQLLAQTPDEVFTAWREEWSAAVLQKRCDGEHIQQKYSAAKARVIDVDEPCLRDTPTPCKCKNTARLPFYLPEFIQRANVLGMFMLTTTSTNDIAALSSYINAIYATAGQCNGIPLILGRAPREISVPDSRNAGARLRVTKHMLYLNIAESATKAVLSMLNTGVKSLPVPIADPQTGEMSNNFPFVDEDESEEEPPIF